MAHSSLRLAMCRRKSCFSCRCRIAMHTHYTSRPARARCFRTKSDFAIDFFCSLGGPRLAVQLAKRRRTIGMSWIRDGAQYQRDVSRRRDSSYCQVAAHSVRRRFRARCRWIGQNTRHAPAFVQRKSRDDRGLSYNHYTNMIGALREVRSLEPFRPLSGFTNSGNRDQAKEAGML